MEKNFLQNVIRQNKEGKHCGIYSCCSANYYVIKAVLKKAKEHNSVAVVEGTSNQINQFGGYTGMTPMDFRNFVQKIAEEVQLDMSQVILGGDHMGPLPWAKQSENQAMQNAKELVKQCVLAGFRKIHLDTSMLLGEESNLTDNVIARRGAILAVAAEEAFQEYQKQYPEAEKPVYVIGSEVPVPGGVEDTISSEITVGENCLKTLKAYEKYFDEYKVRAAYDRIIAIVVHLGVEFKATELDEYQEDNILDLVASMKNNNQIAFEGHSTDFQTKDNLYKMVENNTAILKVGPALTFALREAFFSLENIEKELVTPEKRSNLRVVIENVMKNHPESWEKYYHETDEENKLLRSFSYLDRVRYYLPTAEVQDALKVLLTNLEGKIPLYVLSQYFSNQYKKIRMGKLNNSCEDLILDKIGETIDDYLYAIGISPVTKVEKCF